MLLKNFDIQRKITDSNLNLWRFDKYLQFFTHIESFSQ